MLEPAGVVITYAGSTAPEGWLLCDGSAVSRDTYATLFDVIGTTYGVGDGSTTFNVPDLSGRVVIGVSGTHAIASIGGEESHAITSDEMPSHTHTIPSHGHANSITATTPKFSHSITQPEFKYNKPNTKNTRADYTNACYSSTNTQSVGLSTNVAVSAHAAASCTLSGGASASTAANMTSKGSGTKHNNMQPYLSINYIIKTGV